MASPWSPIRFLRVYILFAIVGFLAFVAEAAKNTKATVLIIARDINSAKTAHSGLQGYGIPYRVLVVPQGGATLPQLQSSATQGNFGGIVVLGDVAYNYGGGSFRSALTDPQWDQLTAYQKAFHVRMVRIDVYPGPKFGKKFQLA